MNYHRTGASYPRHMQPIAGPLTIEERAELIDKLSAGSTPRAALVRKLLRLHDEARAELKESLDKWQHWTAVDITEDDDRWAEFTDGVHDMLRKHSREPGTVPVTGL